MEKSELSQLNRNKHPQPVSVCKSTYTPAIYVDHSRILRLEHDHEPYLPWDPGS